MKLQVIAKSMRLATLCVLLAFTHLPAHAQNTGIGIGIISPHESAILQIVSPNNDKGVLFPSFTSGTAGGIQNPAEGLLIYKTDENTHYQYSAANGWQPLSVWLKNGNNIYNANSGNVGVGTISPASKFNVEGNGAATEIFRVSNDINATKDSTMVLTSAGRLGVGTTAPADKLTVQTSASSYGITHTNGTVTVGTYVNPTSGWLGTKSNHPLYFFTNNSSSLMTVLTNGNVGVGITNPEGKLHVNGALRIGFGNGFVFEQNGAGNLDITYKAGATVLSNIMTWEWDTGDVGIGTTNPTKKLDVNGYLAVSDRIYERNSGQYLWLRPAPAASGGIEIAPHQDNYGSLGESTVMWDDGWITEIYYQSQTNVSDARTKQNIQPITGALASVLKIQGVRYDLNPETHPFLRNMKPDELEDSKGEMGFIAQDLQQVFPHMVKYNEELGLNTIRNKDQLLPVLVEAVKEQQAQIEDLKKQIAALKALLH